MKLYELGFVVALIAAGVLGFYYAKSKDSNLADAYMRIGDKAEHAHETYVEPHRDKEPAPQWANDAFEAK